MELFDDMYAVLAIGARPVHRIICNLLSLNLSRCGFEKFM
jgi:hypothetical protein